MSSLRLLAKVIRLKDWVYLLGICVFAYLDFLKQVQLDQIILSLGFCFACLACGYSFNNLYDKDEDSHKKNIFKSTFTIQQQSVFVYSVCLLVLALAFFLDLLIETFFVMSLNFLYSLPMFRLKNNLIYSLVANSVFFGFLYYATAKIINPNLGIENMPYLVYISFMFLPLQYIHHLEHIEIKNAPSKIQKFILPIILFIPTLSYSFYYLKSPHVLILTALFCISTLITLVYNPLVSKSRIVVRYLAILLGLALLLNSGLSHVS